MRSFLAIGRCSFIIGLALATCAALPARAEMVALWAFDNDGSHAINYDSIGTNNGGTITGSLTYATGMFDQAVDFGNATAINFFGLASVSDFNSATNSYMMTAWFKATDTTTPFNKTRRPFHLENNKIGTCLSIDKTTSVLRPFARDAEQDKVEPSGSTVLTNGDWYNIGYVYDGSTQTIAGYVNGKVDCTLTNTAIGTVSNWVRGNVGAHASGTADRNFAGLLDDLAVQTNAVTPQNMALINGLGRLAGVSMADYVEINAVEAAFNAGAGGFASAGETTWYYTSNLGSTTIGAMGGTVAGGDAFIVLDTAGNGVSVVPVPEPGTLASLAAGCLGLLVGAWRRRK